MKIHELKTDSIPFKDVLIGRKTFSSAMKKPVYKSRERILRRIDAVISRRDALKFKRDLLDGKIRRSLAEAAKATTSADSGMALSGIASLRDQQSRVDVCLARIPPKLNHLKRSLAAFDTVPMAFLEGDRTVVEQ